MLLDNALNIVDVDTMDCGGIPVAFFNEDFGSINFGESCVVILVTLVDPAFTLPLLQGDTKLKLLKLDGVGGENGYFRKFAVSICVGLGGVRPPILLPLGVGRPDILRAAVELGLVSLGCGCTGKGLGPSGEALACCCCWMNEYTGETGEMPGALIGRKGNIYTGFFSSKSRL